MENKQVKLSKEDMKFSHGPQGGPLKNGKLRDDKLMDQKTPPPPPPPPVPKKSK